MGFRVQLNWRSVLAIAIGLGFFSPLPPVEARKINFPSNLGFPGRRVPGGSRG
ncbi:hypothetical protein H6F43_12090, partial [Leptolyngbya sp. FACHB-36]|nr:hypothetical protein [Leptolyngbya sp. FACHB-36]